MRINEATAIIGEKVILVPYRAEHVVQYHKWMLDKELLELTASEPLTLEEEMDMQRKWREDDDKLTFIILARMDESNNLEEIRRLPMVGDVNMFLKDSEAEDGSSTKEAEVEIMIAERQYRRKGLAYEALRLFLSYATQAQSNFALSPYQLVVRIGASNTPSRALFERLGFVICKEVTVFNEVEMRWRWNTERIQPTVSKGHMASLWGTEGKLTDYPPFL